jgi:hypothetical protein
VAGYVVAGNILLNFFVDAEMIDIVLGFEVGVGAIKASVGLVTAVHKKHAIERVLVRVLKVEACSAAAALRLLISRP